MSFLDQLKKYSALAVLALLFIFAVIGYFKYRSYESELARLRNEVASRDVTVEELHGTYGKLASENGDLKASDDKLAKLLDKTNQDLIAETQSKIYWKSKYDYFVGHQSKPTDSNEFKPSPAQAICTGKPQIYTGSQDIGLLKIVIDTYTVDPSYQTKLVIEPGSKPLVLTLDLSRDANKQWHTHVNSNDDRIGVEIGLNSVNIEPLEPRWYERLKVNLDAGVGKGGAIGGVGATFGFGKIDVGPKVWSYPGGTALGATFFYAPFKSN